MNLDSAAQALERGHFAAALELLWPLWAQSRDPTVALAVVLADRAAAPLPESWRTAKRAAMHTTWLTQANSKTPPLGWLAATWSQGTLSQAIERLRWIRAAPTDPRLALGLSAALVSPPFHSLTAAAALYEPMFKALLAMREPATLVQIERSLAMPPWTGQQMAELITPHIEALAASLKKKAKHTTVATSRLTKAMKPLLWSMPDLLPGDDRVALAVAADALQERGDPRGAVLAAQLAGDSTPALVDERKRAQALVAQRARNEGAGKPKKVVLDPEVRVVRDAAELELLLAGRWRARELLIATPLNAANARRLATHQGLAKLQTLVLLEPDAVLEALDAAPLNQTLKALEVRGPFSPAMATWLKSGALRGAVRSVVMPSLSCVMNDEALVCRSNLAEGRPDYVALFGAMALAPGTAVSIEREWMQEPRRGEVIEAAARAGVTLVIR
jgi:hypothetical protein